MANATTFDPNALGQKDAGMYGLPFGVEEAQIVLIPVPWEVTVSYNAGTASGPKAIWEASRQVDLYDPEIPDAWKLGLAMDALDADLQLENAALRKRAKEYIGLLENGDSADNNPKMRKLLDEINVACAHMNDWVQERASFFLDQGKLVGLIGGDHSTPLGLIRELSRRHPDFGILHVDAHADLRDAYEGFTYSHASIMFNVLKETNVPKLVQVAIRDYCEAEVRLIEGSQGRVTCLYDRDLKTKMFEGTTWKQICLEIIEALPHEVYFSFDIDGLDPRLCPNTGTPVPGGLDSEQVLYLVRLVVESGRKIIAFDINEVAPGEDEWDANVAARMLYRIANLAAKSNNKQPLIV